MSWEDELIDKFGIENIDGYQDIIPFIKTEVIEKLIAEADTAYYYAWKEDYGEPEFDGVTHQLRAKWLSKE